jgi:hypothetical protein
MRECRRSQSPVNVTLCGLIFTAKSGAPAEGGYSLALGHLMLPVVLSDDEDWQLQSVAQSRPLPDSIV